MGSSMGYPTVHPMDLRTSRCVVWGGTPKPRRRRPHGEYTVIPPRVVVNVLLIHGKGASWTWLPILGFVLIVCGESSFPLHAQDTTEKVVRKISRLCIATQKRTKGNLCIYYPLPTRPHPPTAPTPHNKTKHGIWLDMHSWRCQFVETHLLSRFCVAYNTVLHVSINMLYCLIDGCNTNHLLICCSILVRAYLPKWTQSGLNKSAMAPHGLILCQHGATDCRKLLHTFPAVFPSVVGYLCMKNQGFRDCCRISVHKNMQRIKNRCSSSGDILETCEIMECEINVALSWYWQVQLMLSNLRPLGNPVLLKHEMLKTGLNKSAMAPHGLILGQHGATGCRKLLHTVPAVFPSNSGYVLWKIKVIGFVPVFLCLKICKRSKTVAQAVEIWY